MQLVLTILDSEVRRSLGLLTLAFKVNASFQSRGYK